MFNGREIRDKILSELKDKIAKINRKPAMAVFLIGDDPVSVNYVNLKQRYAEQIGINFKLFKYEADINQETVLSNIKELSRDDTIDGIMMQIPVPEGWDRDTLIKAINPSKDIDGLRYCLGIDSDFLPPVVLAIEKALDQSDKDICQLEIAIIGKGFLVGSPLDRYLSLERCGVGARTKDDSPRITPNNIRTFDLIDSQALDFIKQADVVISATGQAGLIKPEMIKEGVILIDAGTSESGGKLVGDIDTNAYTKSSFYTPVPGGIGPVTVAMLLQNIVKNIKS